MDTLSTLITSKPNFCSFKTIYSTILCIATFTSLLLLRYSPLVLWFAANAIIFSVYKLSSSKHPNPSDPQADSLHPILASLPLDRWHDYLSPHAEPGPREKEVITHVNTVGKDDKKVSMNEKNMAENTCKAIMMRCSDYLSSPAEAPGLTTISKAASARQTRGTAGRTTQGPRSASGGEMSPLYTEYQEEPEVTHVYTVVEEDQKVTKEKNMDETWKAIMMRRSRASVRKPSLKKSDTWERSQRCLQRADEVGMKPELKKSATYKDGREESAPRDQQLEEITARKGDTGWRTRDVLVVANGDLFTRVENFIKKQHDNLRLQRQESEYRRFLERFRK